MNNNTNINNLSENIIWPLDNELSSDYINRIIAMRGREKQELYYQEEHHIIPRTCGGTDEKDNLVFLYPQEHYEVHKLLALENPEVQGLQTAWWLLCHIITEEEKVFVSAEDYAEAKIRFAAIQSERMTGENNPGYGKHRSEETKRKIGEANSGENSGNYGKKRTEEAKKQQGETFKSHYVKENHPQYGKHPSEETRAKMSKAGKGRKKSEEHKRKIGLAHKGKNHGQTDGNHPMARPVRCIETGEVFSCMKEAGSWCGLKPENASSRIGSQIRGERKTAGKHPETGEPLHWEFVQY